MTDLPMTIYLNGRVCGYQYQLSMTFTYGEEPNSATMIVFDALGQETDRFTKGFHHQYGREFIKRSMREQAKVRDEVPELKTKDPKPEPSREKDRERMSPNFAVFNNHVNGAGDRARELIREFAPTLADEIDAIDEKGIMGVFDKEPTQATSAYVWLVTAFVNE